MICNPPYIPGDQIDGLAREVAEFDPRLALDGGEEGLDPYQAIIPQLGKVLKNEGLAIFEIGDGQERAVIELFEQAGYKGRGTQNGQYRDLAGGHQMPGFFIADKGLARSGLKRFTPCQKNILVKPSLVALL